MCDFFSPSLAVPPAVIIEKGVDPDQTVPY